ncbi:hypothetical protein ES676_09690 [Bizionia saleffrena]|uniref:Lipoprotein n=1 Tax=Bizionia saleffrena TaxID=291189 RepID=A0A8H2LG94_9FLAO|nr:hypothetical protein [Bizionia saleffrena]TYB73020.1 hypothetical protein ES676_09690 [Bizionia saleffrena]
MKNLSSLVLFILLTSCLTEPRKNIPSVDKTEKSEKSDNNIIKRKYGGQYQDKNAGNLTIELVQTKLFKFNITTWNINRPCSGSLSGTAKLISDKIAIYSGEDCQSIKFIFSENISVEIIENDCFAHHGLNCSFSGIYLKNN